ncbi:MAG: tetratricopeptide repeat protein [Candidatus Methylacidiphilales bacterium]
MQPSDPMPPRKRLRPKTYAIGLYVVAGFIVLEMIALAFIFWIRQEVRIETSGPGWMQSSSGQDVDFLDTQPMGKPTETSLPNLPKPEIEARLDLDLKRMPKQDIAKLNEEARAFRRVGDFHLAEAALKQALDLDPNNVLTLTNRAMLEEARGDTALALEAWKNVIRAGNAQPGESTATVNLARERSRLIEQRFRLEEEESSRDQVMEKSRRLITLDKALSDPSTIPDNPLEFKMSFQLRKKSDAGTLSANKIRIQLYFYERTPDNRLVAAPITARFERNPPNWETEGLEILTAHYIKSAVTSQDRKYFGYLLRVYYENELQEERANPALLLRLFPRDGSRPE